MTHPWYPYEDDALKRGFSHESCCLHRACEAVRRLCILSIAPGREPVQVPNGSGSVRSDERAGLDQS
jgi:hypothetical protein